VNPDIKVYVKWAHLHSDRQDDLLRDVHPSLISGRDFIRPGSKSGKFGLYNPHDENEQEPEILAMPVWDWGVFYEKTVTNIINGAWKQEGDSDKNETLNDWWGMSSGMIDVICSKKLPPDTVRLINLLKKGQ
jgi:basic membrane lipoprotein Med (substrate-binding protein (PBP1-ABC) superfamily)